MARARIASAITVVFALACATGRPGERPPVRTNGDEPRRDSLELVEALAEDGAPTEEIEARVVQSNIDRETPPVGMAGWSRVVAGHRRSARVAVTGVHEGAWRRSNDRDAGYVRFAGAIDRAAVSGTLLAGTLRPHVGLGVAVGAARASFSSPRRSPATGFARVRPSLGVGSRLVGGVVRGAAGPYRATAAGWEDADTGVRSSLIALERHDGTTIAGIACACLDGRLWVGSGFFSRSAGWGHVSIEGVFAGRRSFGAVVCRTGTRREWVLELFHRPEATGFSAPAIDPARMGRDQWGGSVHRDVAIGGARVRASAYATLQRRGELERRRRRFEASARVRSGRVRWELTVRAGRDVTRERSRRPVEMDGRTVREGARRARLRATVRHGRLCAQRFEALLLERQGRAGWVVGSRWTLTRGRVDVVVQTGAYDLPPGVPGYVARPGIAGYGTFAFVGGAGVDLSARGRIRLRNGVHLTAFWAQPWQRAARAYVAVDLATGR